MREYVIMTDSCCDLNQQEVDELGLTVLPLSFTIDGKTYLNTPDHAEMSPEEFFAKIAAGENSTTAAANVGQFDEAMRRALDAGKDILCICFSGALSTTYQSARIAAEDLKSEYPDAKILVIDSLSASRGQGMLLYRTVQERRRSSPDIETLAAYVRSILQTQCHWFIVDDLNHLKRGGRVSATAAFVGTMLGIKPVMHTDSEGRLIPMSKARGTKAALKALGKTAAVLCSDAVPSRYSFTAPVMFRGGFEPKTVVAVDVASVQLFGENNGVPQYTRHIDLCIDHHAGNSGYADFTLLDGSAAAAAELLYEVICEMGVEITPLIANCLYTGLATDTGCFRFSSTTANTHLVAAKLILAGAQLEELNTLLFDTKPRERMEAERIARNHLEYHLDDRCALMYLTRDEIEQSGVDPADLEELTSLPISIEGVKVGLTLRQQPGGSYRISVRTAKGVDACAIARRLGGGGHTRAAGCELLGNLDNAKNAILAEVQAELDRPEMQEEG